MLLRILFTIFLIVHALTHVLGFVKEFELAKLDTLRGKTILPLPGESAKVIGILWLVATALFIGTSLAFFIRREWWKIGIAAVLLSQALVFLYWHDARYASIANLIVAIAIFIGYSSSAFRSMSDKEVKALALASMQAPGAVTAERISHLPVAVQKWLSRSGVVGREMIYSVYLKQKGEMRTTQEGNWMEVYAVQYFNVKNPGFIWIADVAATSWMHLAGRDKYMNGKGHMLIKALSAIPVADSKGKEIDQGSMLRYMGENVWFPSGALSPYLKWEEITAGSAKVTMTYEGVTASGVFHFDNNGDVVSFEAKRYYDRKGGATLEDWKVVADPEGYREFEGIRVPAKLYVTWKLKAGDFTWYKLEISEIQYNTPWHKEEE